MSDTERTVFEDELEEEVLEERPSEEVSSEEPVSEPEAVESEPVEESVPSSAFDEEEHNRLVSDARNRVKDFESRFGANPESQARGSEVREDYGLPKTEQEAAEWMRSVTEFITTQKKQQEQQRVVEEYRKGLKDFLDVSVQSIKKKYPDFEDAANYMYTTRSNQLKVFEDMNPEYATQGGVDKVLTQELEWILTKCVQDGKDPAETIYSFAKKLGYKSGVKTTKDLHTMKSKQESHKTLSATTGGRAGGMLSLEEINAMDEDEFRAWYSIDANKKRLDKMVETMPFSH